MMVDRGAQVLKLPTNKPTMLCCMGFALESTAARPLLQQYPRIARSWKSAGNQLPCREGIRVLHYEVAPRVAVYASKACRGDHKTMKGLCQSVRRSIIVCDIRIGLANRRRRILTLRHRALDRPGPAC
jgi:hypothetical protein